MFICFLCILIRNSSSKIFSRYITYRTALFYIITQRLMVISYWRFGTTYRSHLKGQVITHFIRLCTNLNTCLPWLNYSNIMAEQQHSYLFWGKFLAWSLDVLRITHVFLRLCKKYWSVPQDLNSIYYRFLPDLLQVIFTNNPNNEQCSLQVDSIIKK
jgi:hypothetical protein